MPLSKIDSDSLSTPITAVDLAYTGTLTGGSGVVNLGSGQVYKDASGNVGIGTSSPVTNLEVFGAARKVRIGDGTNTLDIGQWDGATNRIESVGRSLQLIQYGASNNISFATNAVERMRIDASGSLLVGKTASSFATAGVEINAGGGNFCRFTRDGGALADFNRLTNDGELVGFWQATTQEGSISVSGSTVSYNGGHLSRWAQTTTAKDDTLVKGTVLSNLDEMNVYTDADGNPVDNEQLNKVKVSDVEGDANVAGVFVNWSHDDAHNVDEINMAMTGDMIIRIAQGATVARGDLLMSAGDGTAKPQGDDIVRSKTVAKVTSTHVTCTYADGSYCVPCVLMAC
jgi:hypothetical protein